jgi:hypothetical protein
LCSIGLILKCRDSQLTVALLLSGTIEGVGLRSTEGVSDEGRNLQAEYDSLLDEGMRIAEGIAKLQNQLNERYKVVPSLLQSLDDLRTNCRTAGFRFDPDDPCGPPPHDLYVEEIGEWVTIEEGLSKREEEAYSQTRVLQKQLIPLKLKANEVLERLQDLLLWGLRNNILISRNLPNEEVLGLKRSEMPTVIIPSGDSVVESEEPAITGLLKQPAAHFPTPEGTLWGPEIEMSLLSGDTLRITVGRYRGRYMYAELGFKNTRTVCPDLLWTLMIYLIENNGLISIRRNSLPSNMSKELNTWVSKLRRRLNAIMGLTGDPFQKYVKGVGWQAKFRTRIDTFVQGENNMEDLDNSNEIADLMDYESTRYTRHKPT